jgi:hypothetical protein
MIAPNPNPTVVIASPIPTQAPTDRFDELFELESLCCFEGGDDGIVVFSAKGAAGDSAGASVKVGKGSVELRYGLHSLVAMLENSGQKVSFCLQV